MLKPLATKFLYPLEEAEGEVLFADLFDEYGKLVFPKNTVLNNYAVKRLEDINVKKVPVYPSCRESNSNNEASFHSIYKESVIAMKELMANLVSGNKTNYNKLVEISNRLYDGNNEEKQLLKGIKNIKDEYTYNHCINVALYSMYIGQLLGFSEENIKDVLQAGLLHDIGKSKIPRNIINKKGKLNEEEFEIIKTHTVIGYEMSKDMSFLKEEIREAILTHHEREDGSGYPLGLKSREISMYAKILAIADVYDALTSKRVYKDKITPFDAINEFYEMGVEKFSRPILSIFFKNIVQCYIDSKIKLNNGMVGEIAYIPPYNMTKPIIDIEGYYVDLEENPSLQIIEIM